MSEKWTLIPGFPGYAASPDGRIYSVASNWRGYGARELAQSPNEDGYPSVRLCIGIDQFSGRQKRKRFAVHKLIAITFLQPAQLGQQMRHLNGEKTDNRVGNLSWGTALENAADREAHGRTYRGAAAWGRDQAEERRMTGRLALSAGLALALSLSACVCDERCQADKQWEAARSRWNAAYERRDLPAEIHAWKDECYWHKRGTQYDPKEPDCEEQQF